MTSKTINELRKQVRKTCEEKNLISRGDHIVLGLSGGPDSMCLYDALLDMARSMRLVIHPVHVNHKFRPGAAERDQAFVEQVCRENAEKYPDFARECRSFIVDCAAVAAEIGMTGEEAGRKVRYDAFAQVAAEIQDAVEMKIQSAAEKEIQSAAETEGDEPAGSVKIAVAHNANDQAETILFRLLRGTGTDGLAGIPYERKEQKTKVIRPLLDVWRRDIEAYCDEAGLKPVKDHTNEEETYSRNRLRLDLIPYIKAKYNENIEGGLVRLGRIAAADRDYIWQETCRKLRQLRIHEGCPEPTKERAGEPAEERAEEPGSRISLEREGLAECHESIRHRVILKAFEEIGLESDISAERLEAADRIIMKKQGEKLVEFPRNYRLRVAKGVVYLERN